MWCGCREESEAQEHSGLKTQRSQNTVQIPSVSGPLSPGTSKSEFRTTRFIPAYAADATTGEVWDEHITVLHRIETTLFKCMSCGACDQEYVRKVEAPPSS